MSRSTTITVPTLWGSHTLTAHLVTEHFAVHPTPMSVRGEPIRANDDTWSVTHLRTGYALQQSLASFADARALAEAIDQPGLNWDFDTPLGSVVAPGCCARLDAVHAHMAHLNGLPTERVRRNGHRYRMWRPTRVRLVGPMGRWN